MISNIVASFLVANPEKSPEDRLCALMELSHLDRLELEKELEKTIVCRLYSSNLELDTLLNSEQSETDLIENAMAKIKEYSDLHNEPLNIEHIKKRLTQQGPQKMLKLSRMIMPGESKWFFGAQIILITDFGGLILHAEGLAGMEAVAKWKVGKYE